MGREVQKFFAEIGKVESQVAVEKARIRGAAHAAHLHMSHIIMQLRRVRQRQDLAHELLHRAEVQLRQAHGSMTKLLSTYTKLRGRPHSLERVHALEEQERRSSHEIKNVRKERLNIEAKIRPINRKLQGKAGEVVK